MTNLKLKVNTHFIHLLILKIPSMCKRDETVMQMPFIFGYYKMHSGHDDRVMVGNVMKEASEYQTLTDYGWK